MALQGPGSTTTKVGHKPHLVLGSCVLESGEAEGSDDLLTGLGMFQQFINLLAVLVSSL